MDIEGLIYFWRMEVQPVLVDLIEAIKELKAALGDTDDPA